MKAGVLTSEAVLRRLLDGDVPDPWWRNTMRDMLARCSEGPFDTATCNDEPMVTVTNGKREVLAKTGPLADATSCFDAILFAASANAVRKLLAKPDGEVA
jgi:hypothetical protein